MKRGRTGECQVCGKRLWLYVDKVYDPNTRRIVKARLKIGSHASGNDRTCRGSNQAPR